MEYTYEDNVWYIGSTANPYLLVKAVVAPSDGSALELNAQTKAIAATAFYACTADVIIPDGVEVIGTYAFYGYQGKSLTLGDGIKKIEDDAFRSCRSILQVNVGSTGDLVGYRICQQNVQSAFLQRLDGIVYKRS